MLNQGIVGVQNPVDSSVPQSIRMGQQGDQIVSELHGRYYEQSVRQKTFTAATQAHVTTTVGLATTYTGLVISNPVGSGVNAEILFASMMQSVIQAVQVEAFAIAVGYNATTNVTHTTPVAVKSNLVGTGSAGLVVADVSATLPTAPVYDTFLTNTATATQNGAGMVVDLGGSIVLPPGGYACFVTPTQASVNGMWFAFKWAENPIIR